MTYVGLVVFRITETSPFGGSMLGTTNLTPWALNDRAFEQLASTCRRLREFHVAVLFDQAGDVVAPAPAASSHSIDNEGARKSESVWAWSLMFRVARDCSSWSALPAVTYRVSRTGSPIFWPTTRTHNIELGCCLRS
jgi:hypothetical protein